MKILAIGAHFDDVELGCGGSLLKWKSQGHDLSIFTATESGYSATSGQVIRSSADARAEGLASSARLGAKLFEGHLETFGVEFTERLNAKLLEVLQDVRPDLMLTHWADDTHHDHKQLSLASVHCARNIPRVLTYQSNSYVGHGSFEPRYFVDISATYPEKLELLRLFKSEHGRAGHRWESFVDAQSVLAGIKAGVARAEGFEVIKWRE